MTLRQIAFSMLFTAALSYADQMPELVTNGGFETGDFSGWTLSGYTTAPCLFVGGANDTRCNPATEFGPHSGNYAAELGNDTANASLSQSIATTGNGTFHVSFWLANQAGDTPDNNFSVMWGNQVLMNQVDMSGFGYTHYDFTGLIAAGPTTELTFTFRNGPAYFALDDVSVVDPVPEAAPFAALGLLPALALCFGLRRRTSQCAARS